MTERGIPTKLLTDTLSEAISLADAVIERLETAYLIGLEWDTDDKTSYPYEVRKLWDKLVDLRNSIDDLEYAIESDPRQEA